LSFTQLTIAVRERIEASGSTGVLMAPPSPVPRLADIIEAIELIRCVWAGVTSDD